MAFSASPAVTVREIDLTGGAPNVTSSTGATVGNFLWGPVEDRTLISNEDGLVSVFAAPNEDNAVDFLSAAYFLKYTNALYVTRMATDSARNACSGFNNWDSAGEHTVLVKNDTHWNNTFKSSVGTGASKTNSGTWIAKYPGALGNALSVSICPACDTDSGSHFDDWDYKGEFAGEPGTSAWAADRGASNDEIHVAVIDRTGAISGTIGGVIETFPYLSVAKGAVTPDNSPNYISDVLNTRSQYIWNGYFGDDSSTGVGVSNWGTTPSVDSAVNFGIDSAANFAQTIRLYGGVNSTDLGTSEIQSGFDLYEDTETVTVDLLIAPQASDKTTADTIVDDMIAIATARKDCVVVTSPHRNGIVGATNQAATDAAVDFANGLTSSSYCVVDNNYLKVYDKYNDNYVNIPAASSTAGLMAATDLVAAPWFSPAGQRRGNYLGVTDIVANPNKTQRDTLYNANVNPIANIPGSGVILFGDKTMLRRPSAFDRINVRRLFLVLERAISIAAKNIMFEFNDEFTRAEFVNIVEPLLREVQGRRGITDFRVVCDETNNTGDVIDRNEFVASIFIKPARSINFVTLNFVAVRTGVEFEEVVGGV
jgi:phage tail sheath protein FI